MSASADLGLQFRKRSPAEIFAEMASYAQDTSAGFDSYGTGATLQNFEAECAKLLGKESACFFLTGTQAQNAAIEAHQPQVKRVALHPTSHIVHHTCLLDGRQQSDGFELLAQKHLPAGYAGVSFGKIEEAPTFQDVKRCLENGEVGVLVLELPQRMNGGAVMPWSDLLKVREEATKRGVKLHMDGARLWEVQPYYDKPLDQICALFDSVYVSFYKGIGAMSGAMLLGTPAFIAGAREAQAAMGGRANTMAPFALHCQLQLQRSLSDFQPRFQRLQHCVDLLSDPAMQLTGDLIRFDPPRPQSAMVHVYVKGASKEELDAAHEAAVEKSGVRLWNFLRGPGHAEAGSELYFEWLMGAENSRVSDECVLEGWKAFREVLVRRRRAQPQP